MSEAKSFPTLNYIWDLTWHELIRKRTKLYLFLITAIEHAMFIHIRSSVCAVSRWFSAFIVHSAKCKLDIAANHWMGHSEFSTEQFKWIVVDWTTCQLFKFTGGNLIQLKQEWISERAEQTVVSKAPLVLTVIKRYAAEPSSRGISCLPPISSEVWMETQNHFLSFKRKRLPSGLRVKGKRNAWRSLFKYFVVISDREVILDRRLSWCRHTQNARARASGADIRLRPFSVFEECPAKQNYEYSKP